MCSRNVSPDFLKIILITLGISLFLSACDKSPTSFFNKVKQGQKPNVLFIAVDDLNDWTGFLGGNPQSKTPNLDKLAADGIYCVRF